jgi:hypothetical protein
MDPSDKVVFLSGLVVLIILIILICLGAVLWPDPMTEAQKEASGLIKYLATMIGGFLFGRYSGTKAETKKEERVSRNVQVRLIIKSRGEAPDFEAEGTRRN